MGQGRRNMLASQRGAVGDVVVHADPEGHPASRETRCLHAEQRRWQQTRVELRNKALEREHVMVLVTREAAHVSVALRGDEPDAVVTAAGGATRTDGDIAAVCMVVELAGEF